MATVLHIASINFNDNVPDALGSLWYVDGLEGWDSPSQRLSSTPLASQHGEVTIENLYAARSMAVTGLCKAAGGASMYESMYYLMAEVNALITPITFRVDEDISRFCKVRRAGEVKTAYLGRGAFRFEMTFRADDPMKYAYAQKTVNLAANVEQELVNAGTVRTYPVFTFTEAGAGNVVTAEGRTWAALNTPDNLVVDMKAMTAKVGGTSYYDHVGPESEWVYLDSGSNTVKSTLAATVVYRDAWV